MVPFPVYPWLHVQVKLPGVLVHVASGSQLFMVALAHRSMTLENISEKQNLKIGEIKVFTITKQNTLQWLVIGTDIFFPAW